MIEHLPQDIQLKHSADLIRYEKYIEELNKKAILAKKELLNENFSEYPMNGSIDDKSKFINQFWFLENLVMFPDDEVMKKLKELKFSNNSLKWFVDYNDIINEINRLNEIKGLLIFPHAYLTAINNHLQIKFFINFIEGFELNTKYNNADTNILYKDYAERNRRFKYNEEKRQTPKMAFFEEIMYNYYNHLEKKVGNRKKSHNMILRIYRGETSDFLSILNIFQNEGISKNKVYNELFPLLKIIMKDVNFLSKEEYHNKIDQFYEANYSKYKIARTKKILQKK